MTGNKLPRLLFFGMAGQFSAIPLQQLLVAGIEVSAVIIPRRGRDRGNFPRRVEPPASTELIINLQAEPNIIHLAWEHQLPVWEVGSLADTSTLALLAGLQPEVVVVACFPYLFPPTLLEMPRCGCLNLHPSLLPAYRGPAPLFWIARQDERRSGVTLHLLDAGIDTGDIVAQAALDRPDGLSEAQLEQQSATLGVTLLLQTLQQLQQGQSLPRRPQPERGASYYPWPCETDFIITPDWPARRAFNFLRGAGGWPLSIQLDERTFPIRTALSYSTEHSLDQPYILLGDEIWVQFQPGVLRARLLP
jgi:methionyl-tRNA formyltransferase